jgi:hypothetical protein
MIELRQTLMLVHKALTSEGIEHALIGGLALAVYGNHRATMDIDFLADGSKKDLIKTCLKKNGFTIRHETLEILQFGGPGFVDIVLANRPLSLEMLTHSVANKHLAVKVARPEDIIGLKIQAYKNDPSRALQDKADIQNLLNLPNLDLALIEKYARLFNEWTVISELAAGTKK